MRRRALLAANKIKEGNQLRFPLYLETIKKSNGDFYREADEVSIALVDWLEQNKQFDALGDYAIPPSVLASNQIYIDGVQVTSLFRAPYDYCWDFYPTSYIYGFVIRSCISAENRDSYSVGEIHVYTD